ncbi:CU044_5270 family protein [Actinoplanes sp. NPDC048796]|uniref:CU044_5270 family protein n=1 Tax=unclassified Actinoplanes TaxID=2626549 RepID=UPI0033F83140
MDETTLTRQLGDETALPSPDRLAPARARLMAELTAASAPPARRSVRPRRSFRLAAAAVAAAVVGAGAVGAVVLREPDAPPVAMVPVAEFLDTAATVAARTTDVVPRGDQYVYLKTAEPGGKWFETWNSVDGEHDTVGQYSDGQKVVLPACVDGMGKSTDSSGKVSTAPCDAQPSYLPDLPTDPKALIAWLNKRNPGPDDKGVNVNGVAKDMWSLADGYWLRPAQRAALYRAVGTVDGITLVPSVKDAAGRTGTGVAWVSPGQSAPEVMWIFDAETHVLLGSPATSVVTPPHVVDKVGQRP